MEITQRCLIRFPSRRDYQSCASQLRSKTHADKALASLELLPLVSAIRCPIDQAWRWTRVSGDCRIEPDRTLQVDTKFYLPHTSKSSLSYDPTQRIPWGVSATSAPKLWPKTKGSRVRVGVVDTGADYEHPDIRASLKKGVNIINRQLSAADDNGHGTHIAGTIAACSRGRGPGGISGVAPKADLYPVKAFDKDGSAYVSDIILAIEWCIANHMNIINMSFGMSEYSASLYQAVKAAYQRNVVIVASSGNNGNENKVDYPAKLPYTIAVGAVNKRKSIAAFSNQGKEVDIYAPGEAIYSTWPGNRYNELNGTSMAAAHVSGAIALLLARKPKLTYTRIKRAITSSALPIATGGPSRRKPGRLNALRAWIYLQSRPVKKKLPVIASIAKKKPAVRQAKKTYK